MVRSPRRRKPNQLLLYAVDIIEDDAVIEAKFRAITASEETHSRLRSSHLLSHYFNETPVTTLIIGPGATRITPPSTSDTMDVDRGHSESFEGL